MKLIKLPLVVLLASSVAACDTTEQPKTAQRDVYNSLEDCVADWGDTELCQAEMKQAREHAEKMAAAQGSSGGGGAFVPIFMGPSYSGGDRAFTTSDGRRVVPQRTSSARTANYTPMVGGGIGRRTTI